MLGFASDLFQSVSTMEDGNPVIQNIRESIDRKF